MRKSNKQYWEMNTAELREATKEYDAEELGLPGKPLSAKGRRLLDQASRKRGRPMVGKGAQRVLVSIEKDLLAKADATAERLQMSRSELIARGLRAAIACAA